MKHELDFIHGGANLKVYSDIVKNKKRWWWMNIKHKVNLKWVLVTLP